MGRLASCSGGRILKVSILQDFVRILHYGRCDVSGASQAPQEHRLFSSFCTTKTLHLHSKRHQRHTVVSEHLVATKLLVQSTNTNIPSPTITTMAGNNEGDENNDTKDNDAEVKEEAVAATPENTDDADAEKPDEAAASGEATGGDGDEDAPTLVETKPNGEAKLMKDLDDEAPKTFPQVLLDILSNEEDSDTVSWLPHGRSFIIYKKKKFAANVLPKYFKATKFTSFTRKLNRWGFTRVTRGPEMGSYYHKLFVREDPSLCLRMSSHSSSKFQDSQQQIMPAPMAPMPFVMPFGMPGMQPMMPGGMPGMDPSQQNQYINQQLQQLQWQQFQLQQLQQQQQGHNPHGPPPMHGHHPHMAPPPGQHPHHPPPHHPHHQPPPPGHGPPPHHHQQGPPPGHSMPPPGHGPPPPGPPPQGGPPAQSPGANGTPTKREGI